MDARKVPQDFEASLGAMRCYMRTYFDRFKLTEKNKIVGVITVEGLEFSSPSFRFWGVWIYMDDEWYHFPRLHPAKDMVPLKQLPGVPECFFTEPIDPNIMFVHNGVPTHPYYDVGYTDSTGLTNKSCLNLRIGNCSVFREFMANYALSE